MEIEVPILDRGLMLLHGADWDCKPSRGLADYAGDCCNAWRQIIGKDKLRWQ